MKLRVLYPKVINKEDELHKKHTEIVKFCKEKGVSLPIETAKFFRVHQQDTDNADITRSTRLPIVVKEYDILSEGFSQHYTREYDLMQFEIDITDAIENSFNKTIIIELTGFDNEEK